MRRGWLLLDFAVALGGFAYFEARMHYPLQLAMLTGLALGALCFSSRHTAGNLWQLYRPPSSSSASSSSASSESADEPASDSGSPET